MNQTKTDIRITAIVKPNGERYVYLFGDGDYQSLCRVLAKHACNPGLSFTWKDAASVMWRVRKDNLEWVL